MQHLKGREILVPASIGNLGPGFDTLGLALSLYLRVRVREVLDDGRGRLVCRFVHGAPQGRNGIARAYAWGARRRRYAPSVAVDVHSDIPQRAGLGSSAAATVAGLQLRNLVDGPWPHDLLMAAACEFERHPDNAAAALFGGLTSSCVISEGRVDVEKWPWPPAWSIVVATPDAQLSTAQSRRQLPARVPLSDAVFNLQRMSRLLAAVRDRNAGALREALADRCHQDYRRQLVPQLREALDLQHPDLLGVCLSGAGPSVVAIAHRSVADVALALDGVYRRAGVPCTVRRLTVHESS